MSKQNTYEKRSEQLRQKIGSKITVSTFLAGFNFAALTFVLTLLSDEKEGFFNEVHSIFGVIEITNALLFECVAAMFLISAAFFVAAVYCYDRLLMPKNFWTHGTGSIGIYIDSVEEAKESWEKRLKRWQKQMKKRLTRWREQIPSCPSRMGVRIIDFIMKRSYNNYNFYDININNYEWKFISDLKREKISKNVHKVFKTFCLLTLPPKARVLTEYQGITSQSWQIIDAERFIRITKKICKQPCFTYSNITTDIQADLNRGIVPGDVQNIFKVHNYKFNEATTVASKEKDKHWLITDKDKKFEYLLEKNNDDLNFYQYEVKVSIIIEKLAQVRRDDLLLVYFLMLFAWFTMFIPATISSTIGILLMLFALTKKISIFIFIGICLSVFIYYQVLKPRLGTD